MNKNILSDFGREVLEGLSEKPKRLSSKWFYDEKGDKLFVEIMKMPEYYLTDCEFEILKDQGQEILESFGFDRNQDFDLFELGAGDGTKTLQLLIKLRKYKFTYRPIDISKHAIQTLTERVNKEISEVAVEGIQGEYFNVLGALKTNKPKVILFMGSNIGNLLDDRANDFLKQLSVTMNAGDKLMLGVDLKKSKSVIYPAYNDEQGITARFNLNLLHRINSELGGNFNIEEFEHVPEYNGETGHAYSYLKSLRRQSVRIDGVDMEFNFDEGEKIFMEVSRKYDSESLATITKETGLTCVRKFYDSRGYFCDAVFEKSA